MYLPPRGPTQSLIGITIPIPNPWNDEIYTARLRYGDELGDMITPHITLVGPLALNDNDWGGVIVQLDNSCDQVPAFDIELAGTGTFRPVSPVVFIQVTTGFAECSALAAKLNQGLLAHKARFGYHPHVTLAHEVSDAQLDRAAADFASIRARFAVDALWLSQFDDDGVWRKRFKFDLRG